MTEIHPDKDCIDQRTLIEQKYGTPERKKTHTGEAESFPLKDRNHMT
jgi:hypothetical protein